MEGHARRQGEVFRARWYSSGVLVERYSGVLACCVGGESQVSTTWLWKNTRMPREVILEDTDDGNVVSAGAWKEAEMENELDR